MAKEAPKEPKSPETDATKVFKAGEKLVDENEVALPPPLGSDDPDHELVNNIKRQMRLNLASQAKTMSDKSKVDAEIDYEETVKRKQQLKNAPVQPASPVLPSLSSVGSGGRSALLQLLIQSIPEGQRKEFIEKHLELLVSTETSGRDLLSLFQGGKGAQQQVPAGNGVLDAAAMMATIGAETRENLKFGMDVAKQQTPVAGVGSSTGNVDAVALIKMITDSNEKIIAKVTEVFSTSITGMKDQFKEITDTNRTSILEMQKELLEARKALMDTKESERDKAIAEALKKIEESRKIPNNVLTLDQVPMLTKQLEASLGLLVAPKGQKDIQVEKEYQLKNRELDIQENERDRQYNLEIARQQSNAVKMDLLKTTILGGLEKGLLKKSIETGGSPAAKMVSGE